MTILVGYASTHQSTKGIAEAIAARLSAAGLAAELRALDQVGALGAFDAAVIGSAVHNQRWLPEAAAFVRRSAVDLAARPVWLFSVSSVGETTSFFGRRLTRFIRRMRRDTAELTELRRVTRARGHRHFAGVIERDHWGRLGNVVLRVCGGSFGDHRDFSDVGAWAEGIALALAPKITAPEVIGARP